MKTNQKELNSIFKDLSNQVNESNPSDILDFAIKYLQAKKEKIPFNYTLNKEIGEKRNKSQDKNFTPEKKIVVGKRANSQHRTPKKNRTPFINLILDKIDEIKIDIDKRKTEKKEMKNKEFDNDIPKMPIIMKDDKKDKIRDKERDKDKENLYKNLLKGKKKEKKEEEKKEEKKEEIEEEEKSIKSIKSSEENDIMENDESEFLPLSKMTKIVATIGPASDSPEMIKKLYEKGVNVFRLNFSHGTHESHGKVIDTIRSLNLNAAIMLDTKGPEIRIGEIRDKVHCKIGDTFILTINEGVYEDTGKISVNYPGFIDDVDIDDVIVIDSGILQAEAIDKNDTDITFKVIEGECDITTKRHVNLHGRPVSLPTVTEQDWKDIDFGIEKKVDFIALSFVRTGDDVAEVREHCRKKGQNIQVISKIENFESTQNLEAIIIESDGIMFARGDLSCEISFGEVPTMQKKVVSLCSYYAKPIIIATQMVISMVTNIQPTRAEVSDVGNAIFEGADAIMTSDETTKSLHPDNVIKTMAKIVRETESNVYSICEKPDCDDCFGVLHRGRLQRSGFESVNYYRKPQKAKGLQRQSSLDNKRKFSCTSIDMNPNLMKENIIHILPFITDDIECICTIEIDDDYYAKNICASRMNIPIFAFTSDLMLSKQMNLIWNCQPKLVNGICQDLDKSVKIVDDYMIKRRVRKYLLVCDYFVDGVKDSLIQVRAL